MIWIFFSLNIFSLSLFNFHPLTCLAKFYHNYQQFLRSFRAFSFETTVFWLWFFYFSFSLSHTLSFSLSLFFFLFIFSLESAMMVAYKLFLILHDVLWLDVIVRVWKLWKQQQQQLAKKTLLFKEICYLMERYGDKFRIVDLDHFLGPIKVSKIFKGKCFLLTCTIPIKPARANEPRQVCKQNTIHCYMPLG